MISRNKLAAVVAAGVLAFGAYGLAFAAAPGATEQGVSPVLHDGANIDGGGNNGNNDHAACAAGDVIELGDSSGDGTSTNGVTVHMVAEAGEAGEQDNEVDFTVDGGVVTIAYVKGGNGYNTYDYTGLGGVAWDADLYSPVNGSGNPAGLSHAVFCTGQATPPSFSSSQEAASDVPSDVPTDAASFTSSEEAASDVPSEPNTATAGTGTSGPSSGSWLLVAGLGVLLASVVVMTPARVKNRR